MDHNVHFPDFDGFRRLFEKARNHVKRHQVVYSFGTGIAVTGVTVLIFRRAIPQGGLRNTAFLVFRNRQTVNNVVITQLERRGHPGYIIRCNETGEVFASINRAANAMELNQANIVHHLKGRVPHVGGHTFEVLGEAV